MIYHSQPTLTRLDFKITADILRSGYLGQGKTVSKFEKAMARYLGREYALATNSGTSGLHLALLSLGIGRGDEIILPSYVCSAVLNAVNYTGARPVLTDIDQSDFNISLADTRKKITKHTKAIIVPHIFGFVADIRKFLGLDIPVIEDCAQSIGALYQRRKTGAFGNLAIFSFYATKMLTTGYGGMVVTNNKIIARRIKNLREFDNRDDYITRYNYQMSELQAALGWSQLKQLPGFLTRRRAIARQYDRALRRIPNIIYHQIPRHSSIPSYYRYVVGVKKPSEFIRQMHQNNIEVKRPVYKPLHRYLGLPTDDFPVTEMVYRTAVSLPIYPTLSDKSVLYIVNILERKL